MDATRGQDDPLDRLTRSQQEAVTAEDQRLCVIAGAGAGKTTVLTLRVSELVEGGVDPSHILVVTFSRRAAQELRERLWQLEVEGVRCGTFHATALELVEVRRSQQGLPPVALLPDRRRSLARMLEREGWRLPRSAPASLDTEISWAKGRAISPSAYELAAQRARRRPSIPLAQVAAAWARYEEGKARHRMLDFDDLIAEAAAALEDEGFARAVRWRTRHLLVDEFQDVSPAQMRLAELLLAPDSSLFCVGDPNQSIYAFNGADPALIASLEQRFPGLRTIALDANHRSSPEIVEAASAVLPPEERREVLATASTGGIPTIACHADDRAEAIAVGRRHLELHRPGGRHDASAVLARTNAQLDVVERALADLGIPTRRLAPDLSADEPSSPLARRAGLVEEEDGVVLATFHRAKGLEWPNVFVVGASDGFVPHVAAATEAAVDEERRLLYVALTRAEQCLSVSWALRRDGEEPRSMPERTMSPLLAPMSVAIERMQAERRPASADRASRHIAEMRRGLAAARAARAEGEQHG